MSEKKEDRARIFVRVVALCFGIVFLVIGIVGTFMAGIGGVFAHDPTSAMKSIAQGIHTLCYLAAGGILLAIGKNGSSGT